MSIDKSLIRKAKAFSIKNGYVNSGELSKEFGLNTQEAIRLKGCVIAEIDWKPYRTEIVNGRMMIFKNEKPN